MSNSKQLLLAESTRTGAQAEQQSNAIVPPLWYVLALAFSLRVALSVLGRWHWFNADTPDYFRMADAIRLHHPYAYFPNGYPLLIAACQSLLPASAVPAALIGLNVVLGTAIVAMVYFFTLRLTGSAKAGLIAALVTALYPNQLNYTFQLLTETPSAFLLSLGIACLMLQRASAAGWWLYLASTFRATLLLVGPFLILIGLILHRPKAEMIKLAAGFALGWLVFFALEQGHMIKPASNLSANLLISIDGDSQHLNFSYNRAPQEALDSAAQVYTDFAFAHPKEFVRQRAIAVYELWGPLPGVSDDDRDLRPRTGLLNRLLIGLRFPLLLLALWGGWMRRHEFLAWTLFTPILLITLIHTMTFATHRFTYPVEPLAIALAVTAVFDWRNKHNALDVKAVN